MYMDKRHSGQIVKSMLWNLENTIKKSKNNMSVDSITIFLIQLGP